MVDVTYTVGFDGNFSALKSKHETFVEGLKSKPLVIPVDLGKADTSQTEKFRDAVKQQAIGLDEIITKSKVIENIKTGEQTRVAAEQTRKWTDSLGATFVETTKLKGALEGVQKGFRVIGEETSTQKVTSATQKLSKEYETANKSIQGMSQSAKEFLSKSENMTGKQVDLAKKSADSLVNLSKEWDKAYAEGRTDDLKRIQGEMQKLNNEFRIQEAGTKRGAGALRSWAENMQNAIKQTISYTFSLGAMRIAQQAFNQTVEYAVDLNKEMVNIQLLQVEGARTSEDLNSLAQSYNGLAKELGATTLEVARGSVEWLRQGKTIEETQELLRASTMLSKLGNIEAAEATEYLTSTINSFKMSADEAVSIVDKLVAVDNIAATSTKELATALKYVAAVAGETGVSLEQLISYVGVISSTTRLNAESIGQALKTMLTRMQDIRAGKIDEDGLGINNVAIALERVDVALMESETEFRDFGTVLEDLAGKWDTLNEVEQANISKAIAGVRQANMFTILMTNMSQALEYQNEQLNASGLAMDRYGFYMKGVEASQNKLKASLEGFFMTAKGFQPLIITMNDLASSVLNLLSSMGGLPTILTIVASSLLLWKKSNIISLVTNLISYVPKLTLLMQGLSMSTSQLALHSKYASLGLSTLGGTASKAAVGVTALKTALINPYTIAVLGITAVALGINYISTSSERAIENAKKLNDQLKSTASEVSSLSKQRTEIQELWKEYEELSKKTGKSETEFQRFYEVQEKIVQISPEIKAHYDEEGRLLLDQSVTLEEVNRLLQEQIDKKRELLSLDADKAVRAEISSYKKLKATLEETAKMLEQGKGLTDKEFYNTFKQTRQEIEKLHSDTSKAFSLSKAAIVQNFSAMGFEARNAFIKSIELSENNELYQAILSLFGAGGNSLPSVLDPASLFNLPSTEEAFDITLEGIQNITKELELYNSISEKLRNNDILGINPDDLVTLGLDVENINGEWKLTEDSLELVNERWDEQIAIISALNPELGEYLNKVRDGSVALQELDTVFMSNQSMLQGIAQSYQETGRISYEQAMNMVQAGYAEALSINAVTGEITIKASVLRELVLEEANAAVKAMEHAYAQAVEDGATRSVTQALWAKAQALKGVASAIATGGGFTVPSIPSFGGSGGSGGAPKEKTPEELEKERLKEEIKGWEKEKKVWKDRLDAFKKYIKAQKEALKLKKEELDFNRKLAQKNKDLAELQAEIALLALDNSEEAIARRLELEQEAADLEVEIAEDKEDRKYEVQVDALDKAEQQYEDFVNAQIDGFDAMIEKNNELIEALDKLIASMTGSGGGGGSGGGIPAVTMSIEEARAKLEQFGISMNGLKDIQIQSIASMIDKWIAMGMKIDDVIAKAREAARVINIRNAAEGGFMTNPIGGGGSRPGHIPFVVEHDGGLIESHHNGDFAGGLRSNEVFAKLLKGEYVSTENQMSNFMKNVLPRIASEIPSSSKSGAPVISLSMPITVEGNLDKSVIPDLDKIADKVIKEINTSLKQRGYVRQTTLTGYV